MPSSPNYSCNWMPFAERHYAKVFSKKYKGTWLTTRNDIIEVAKRIDNMLEYKRADLIASVSYHKLVKLDFAIAGTRVSPKASGNRCILHIDEEVHHVEVLLAYSKNDLGPPNETSKWKQAIAAEYPDIRQIFSL